MVTALLRYASTVIKAEGERERVRERSRAFVGVVPYSRAESVVWGWEVAKSDDPTC